MKIGITLGDDAGMESDVCPHFGQCSHFLIVEVENGKVKDSKVVTNGAQHGGGACLAVNEILKYGVTHVIAGGMGYNAQQKFINAGVKIFSFQGSAKDAVSQLLRSKLDEGIDACHESSEHGCH